VVRLLFTGRRSLKPATNEKPALKAQDLMFGRRGKNFQFPRFFLALGSAFQVKKRRFKAEMDGWHKNCY
jgi:hypothetical protein